MSALILDQPAIKTEHAEKIINQNTENDNLISSLVNIKESIVRSKTTYNSSSESSVIENYIDKPQIKTYKVSVKEENTENPAVGKTEKHIKTESSASSVKTEVIKNESSSKSSNSHHHSHRSSSDRKHHSSRHHSKQSSNHCSRCYKRSKIKLANIGVQCKRDKDVSSKVSKCSVPNSNLSDPFSQEKNTEILDYNSFIKVEPYPNGGATVVHMYQEDIDNLNDQQVQELATEFFRIVFSEDENLKAHHVMGIVHNAASYLPDLLEYMAEHHPNLTVKNGFLARGSDIETCTMSQYQENVVKSYCNGTIRFGPLHQISLVGTVDEEVGGYFPDLLARLEDNPFLHMVCTEFELLLQ